MPVSKIEWTKEQSGWALWHITESEEALALQLAPEVCPREIVSKLKRLEWMAGRILIKTLVEKAGLVYKGLYKDEFGKPYLMDNAHQISLSHSYPHVAAQLDHLHSVGIDVEQPKEKLLKIAHRVLSQTEEADAGNNIQKNCVYWCAKEALYKIYGKRGLSFSEHLNVFPFELNKKGSLMGKISAQNTDRLINLEYSLEDEFVLVYTKIS
jgi:4'-phosphopantetheinyl transferase